MSKSDNVRVRIAPSPTGYLHVGTARAALYNWIFARKNKGTFILRIEDTDIARSSQEMVKSILDGLLWLGLKWDEGPIYQSNRMEMYKEYVDKLIKEGLAYYCYCTPEELAERREKAKKEKKDLRYDRRCLHLTENEKKKFEEQNRKKAVRFLVPKGETCFDDIVHGEIKKENSEIEDFVIMKSDGTPTYNLAVVVDDYKMGISHIIRGDDHISNTPKQILLYEALNLEPPEFAHLPLVLGKDKSKLSKRHGAISVTEFREKGFLPDAMFNFLSLLGWNPGDDREIISREKIIQNFSLKKVKGANAVFDMQKLEWMNGVYIKNLNDEELLKKICPFLEKEEWFDNTLISEKKYLLLKLVHLLKGRMRRLTDFVKYSSYFFIEVTEYEEAGVRKHFKKKTADYLGFLIERINKENNFTKERLEDIFRNLAEKLDIKPAKLIHPVRLAVTGMTVGFGLFEILEIVGKETVIKRLTKAIKYIKLKYNMN
jgi:nondiscriminating glutamyl-tRNA synthetase